MTGSKVKIWKQDPSVKPIGIRPCYIHSAVQNGPKDDEIEIKGMPFVTANPDGDFLFDPESDLIKFDTVHTFTVVRQVLTMYKRALKNMEVPTDFAWQWGTQPISVYPHAGQKKDAYYSRLDKELRFFYFDPKKDDLPPLVYTCQSFDVVAHETGHAILDGLQPGYLTSGNAQTGGLHESFGDLTAIFTMLAQMDQCEAIIAESKANLHAKKMFFPSVAEQIGKALYGRDTGLRNADNNLKLSQVSNEVHDISKVFTGAVYDILADMFESYHNPTYYDPAESLFRVGKHLTYLVILAILNAPTQNATYKDIAENMVDMELREEWKKIIRTQFTKREIWDPPSRLAVEKPQELRWDRCCGTLRRKERVEVVEEAIKRALEEKH